MSMNENLETPAEVKAQCDAFRASFAELRSEIGKVMVGQQAVVDAVLVSLFAGGNVLLEGVPVSENPDTGHRSFEFQRGPIFAQVVLADEINRATPKTQSALLEAMQEHSVTVAGETYKLAEPFLVLATQNPIEQEGTYPLPEAQMDRFLLKVDVGYAGLEDLMEIIDRTTGAENPVASKVIDGPKILEYQELVRQVVVAPHVKQYAARLVLATHPESDTAAGGPNGPTNRYVR